MKKIGLIGFLFLLVIFGVISVDLSAQAGIADFFLLVKDVLTVKDNKVFYNNQPIMLAGVAVGDPQARRTIYRRETSDYATIKNDWRANLARLSVFPGQYRDNEKKYKETLEEEIAAARGQGLFVIVDWHAIGFPNGWYKDRDQDDGITNFYSYDSNFNTAREFWKYLAVKYRHDRGVMFEIWNEPADQKAIAWREIKPYLQQLVDIIRANGAENIIIAPGVWWTYDLRNIKSQPLRGDNIAYAWHAYPPSDKYLSWSTAMDNLFKAYPIFVTEWGFGAKPGDKYYSPPDEYPENFKKYLLGNGLHFTAWSWHNPWDPRMLERDWVTLTGYGKFVKQLLNDIDSGVAVFSTQAKNILEKKVNDFIDFGVDENSVKMGRGERSAVVYSFKRAFGRLPESEADLADVYKIANGRVPTRKNLEAEKRAMAEFYKIYLRPAKLSDSRDYMAVMVMAYGLRQIAANRNLSSEAQGIKIFKAIYKKLPQATEEWNITQAITYSGAKR